MYPPHMRTAPKRRRIRPERGRVARAQRGVALVETALVIALTLIMLESAIQLAILGFNQLSADGATAFNTRYHAIGSTALPETITQKLFPKIKMSGSLPDAAVATAAPILTGPQPVNYGYANPNARYGGASLVPGVLSRTSVNKAHAALLPLFGKFIALGVRSDAMEPAPVLLQAHQNLGGFATIGDAMAGATSYYGSTDDLPVSFGAFADVNECVDDYNSSSMWSSDGTCQGYTPHYIPSAEMLTDRNVPSASMGTAPEGTGTFWQMRYHQQEYAQFAKVVETNTQFPTVDVADASFNGSYTGSSLPNSPYLCAIYSWNAAGWRAPNGANKPMPSSNCVY